MNLPSASISPELLNWMKENLSGNLLELGSGKATPILREHFDRVFSIEDQADWFLEEAHPDTTLIPLIVSMDDFFHEKRVIYKWYQGDILRDLLSGTGYDAILIDGPDGNRGDRRGFYINRKLFDLSVPIIVDDTHRPEESELLQMLHLELPDRKITRVDSEGGKRWSSIILPK